MCKFHTSRCPGHEESGRWAEERTKSAPSGLKRDRKGSVGKLALRYSQGVLLLEHDTTS